MMVDAAERKALKPLSVPRLLWRGVTRRCPLCGSRHVFKSVFQVKERCPRCNFPIVREEGHWIGALGMNTIVTFSLLFVTMMSAFLLTIDNRRALPIVVPCLLVALVFPVVFYGPSQTVWSAMYLALRPVEPGDHVDPQWVPALRT